MTLIKPNESSNNVNSHESRKGTGVWDDRSRRKLKEVDVRK